MKAIVYTKFGPPEVLQVKEVEKPSPKENEVLIGIYASTVSAEDPGVRSGPGLNGLRKPRNPTPGMHLAGDIEAVGAAVCRQRAQEGKCSHHCSCIGKKGETK